MLKRSLLWVGIAGASLLAAAEPAPKSPDAAAPVVTEEESITIVAVPCSVAPGQCADKKTCDDKKKCDDKKVCPEKKKCDDKKACPEKKKCDDKKAGCAMPTPDYSDGDYDLAYCFMETSGLPAAIADANGFIILEQMEQAPMLEPARPAFEKFFHDHCSYHALKRDLARIHLATFTRDEMKKLIDFFRSPEGKKFAANQAKLNHHALALRAERIHRNLPELQKNVRECMAKTQQNAAPQNAAAK